ncbi:uncharacterized protein LOC131944205 [Physella acuta]|uniref:uncharacterized protein LOC131944205 n=1 Tax=Physella acuta TaxID=109671 RepID=UPI0027DAD5A7|nr:uncharacterized protein LOC131944205 [Physella acuta]
MAENSNTFAGTHEVQECLAGESEASLAVYRSSCEKKPGHEGFIPVKSFTLDHLPAKHRDEDLYKLTRAIADLTVRVAVEYTSLARPELDPLTKVPYPSHNTRGASSLRTGTGMVFNVDMYSEGMEELDDKKYRTCPCPECDHSASPSKVWWEIKVMTARHVVFDDSEARQSRCRLWFDED